MELNSAASPRVEMLVLQPTPFCNINCSYCYLPDRAVTARMSQKTVKRTFESLIAGEFLSNNLTVLWHAGEPLVLGIGYYERALSIIEDLIPAGLSVTHNFQTNGTLIDDDWARFFLNSNVSLGLSIDGPRRLHDRNRRTRGDRGTFDKVMRGVRILNERQVPFHVITVLTRESLRSARELFDFYLEIGAGNIGFNIEEIEGGHVSSSLQTNDVDAEMRRFFEEFCDLCQSDPARLKVREFDGVLHAIINPESAAYGNPLTEPLRMVSVGVNGDLSTFSPELLGYASGRHGSFVFGNIHHNEIADILDNPRYRLVNAEIQRGLEKCQSCCEYFELCRGGAPVNKYFENGTFDSTETMFCRLTKKAVVDVVLQRLEETLAA
ncbi:MAG: uncharacterized protein QOH32_4646, partial [Bradyrhizobium sp.]|nr:uncharacterized protein [Bradyrhizobium sp.]